MDGELAHLGWNAASKSELDRLGDKERVREARISRRDAAAKRDALHRRQLGRIAQLKREIRNEKRKEYAVREHTRALAAVNHRMRQHREALATHRAKAAQDLQQRTSYKLEAPWNKADADTKPWIVFLHDPDDVNRVRRHAHDSTLRPKGGEKFFPPGHFADFANKATGPRFEAQGSEARRLHSRKMAEKAKELMRDVAFHGRQQDFTKNHLESEVQPKVRV